MLKNDIYQKFKNRNLRVLIPTDPEFNIYKKELQILYKKNQDKIKDTNSFSFLTKYTLFYSFLFNREVLGAIYFFMEDSRLFLNAFSIRKRHIENLIALKLSLTWFNCDIYAEAQNKASAFCLLKSGFVRVKDNLFVYKH